MGDVLQGGLRQKPLGLVRYKPYRAYLSRLSRGGWTDLEYKRQNQNTRRMAKNKYYPEEVLVEKVQKGEYGWLDYVNHYSEEWQEEYTQYCLNKGLCICEDSARQFVVYKDKLLEEALERGDA